MRGDFQTERPSQWQFLHRPMAPPLIARSDSLATAFCKTPTRQLILRKSESVSGHVPVLDLGIIVTENLKVSEQCAKVTKTANKVLGIIKWSYEDKSMANLLPL